MLEATKLQPSPFPPFFHVAYILNDIDQIAEGGTLVNN